MRKEEFLANLANINNHRVLLWEALERTKDSRHPVLEMGCGDGSTPYLRQYCKDNNREFISLETNPEWAAKHSSKLISTGWPVADWFWMKQYSVVLIDHKPGEHRRVALELFAAHPVHFEIIVIHDSEPQGWNSSDYQVRPLFSQFQFCYDLISKEEGGAWASLLSNNYPVTRDLSLDYVL